MYYLFAFTFAYGVFGLLGMTKLTDVRQPGLFQAFFKSMNEEAPGFFRLLDYFLLLFCLGYQAYYWLT